MLPSFDELQPIVVSVHGWLGSMAPGGAGGEDGRGGGGTGGGGGLTYTSSSTISWSLNASPVAPHSRLQHLFECPPHQSTAVPDGHSYVKPVLHSVPRRPPLMYMSWPTPNVGPYDCHWYMALLGFRMGSFAAFVSEKMNASELDAYPEGLGLLHDVPVYPPPTMPLSSCHRVSEGPRPSQLAWNVLLERGVSRWRSKHLKSRLLGTPHAVSCARFSTRPNGNGGGGGTDGGSGGGDGEMPVHGQKRCAMLSEFEHEKGVGEFG